MSPIESVEALPRKRWKNFQSSLAANNPPIGAAFSIIFHLVM